LLHVVVAGLLLLLVLPSTQLDTKGKEVACPSLEALQMQERGWCCFTILRLVSNPPNPSFECE